MINVDPVIMIRLTKYDDVKDIVVQWTCRGNKGTSTMKNNNNNYYYYILLYYHYYKTEFFQYSKKRLLTPKTQACCW